MLIFFLDRDRDHLTLSINRMRGRRKGFLCPATLLPLLMLAISINLMTTEVEAAKGNEFADIEENDFAEFDFDDETDESVGKGGEEEEEDEFDTILEEADDATVEDEAEAEDDEFSHFNDDEEFEGFNKNDDPEDPDEFYNEPKTNKKQEKVTPSPAKQQPIKIVNIPAHLRTNWENFYVEIIMIIGIVIYFLNFFTGKSKNQKMANTLFQAHRGSLESQFSLVGDDGTKNLEEIQEPLIKESENIFR